MKDKTIIKLPELESESKGIAVISCSMGLNLDKMYYKTQMGE